MQERIFSGPWVTNFDFGVFLDDVRRDYEHVQCAAADPVHADVFVLKEPGIGGGELDGRTGGCAE